ncbi:MAG: L-seryl-tRNA(Sec) selenium transferase [Deltaproteobacteria bacterium]|nr:L-seryl-tRNA(Sec) selenium transferase [Deltaproteobacteria bacterium]
MEPEDRQRYLRALPAVDELFRHPQSQAHLKIYSKALVVASIRRVLERKRQAILRSASEQGAGAVEMAQEHLLAAVEEELAAATRPSLRPVINATGVVLHTNLGRAPLCAEALRNIGDIASRYSNLELDLITGERGSRYEHVEEILRQISGAESVLVVNNNAGAVLLALNSLAEGKEVIVSRGQLVEIGGSFRIPDVMRKSGARLVEVGTTNRTHLKDYEQAINQETALLLKVHTSNFRILGFTAEVSLKELVALGQAKGLPIMEDLGSGCFVDLAEYGIEKEPTVQEAIEAGVDVVTFSGDKLLGGPQAGIILGKKKYLDILKKNPLNRALRIDKLTLAGMESTIRVYLNKAEAIKSLPVLRMLTCRLKELERRAKRLQRRLAKELSSVCQVKLKEETSQVGGGALPLQILPTRVIALRPLEISAADLEKKLRHTDPPVIARVKEEEVLLDLRTVAETEERLLLEGVRQALK